MNHRTILIAAAILGASGVALGAAGAHSLRATLLASGMTIPWETAARYHLLHAIALLGLAAWLQNTANGSTSARWAASSWITGLLLFCGSLYWLSLGGPRWLGMMTPLGGVVLLAGWLLLIPAALAGKRGSIGRPAANG